MGGAASGASARVSAGAAGADVCANVAEPVVLYPWGTALIPTGLNLEIPEGYEKRLGVTTVTEGRFHQVKKMFLSRNKCVIYLKRISIAGVKLDFSLETGEFRELHDEEVKLLYLKAGVK